MFVPCKSSCISGLSRPQLRDQKSHSCIYSSSPLYAGIAIQHAPSPEIYRAAAGTDERKATIEHTRIARPIRCAIVQSKQMDPIRKTSV